MLITSDLMTQRAEPLGDEAAGPAPTANGGGEAYLPLSYPTNLASNARSQPPKDRSRTVSTKKDAPFEGASMSVFTKERFLSVRWL
jgi:hypothetical protein